MLLNNIFIFKGINKIINKNINILNYNSNINKYLFKIKRKNLYKEIIKWVKTEEALNQLY